MNTTTISKSDLEGLFGYDISDEEYITAYYCHICDEWTTLSNDGYPNCQCN